MLKILALLSIALLHPHAIDAHGIWIETSSSPRVDQKLKIEIFFGEYGQDIKDEIDPQSPNAKNLGLWIITPDQRKITLPYSLTHKSYVAHFTPQEPGIYHVYANNTAIEIKDWSKYDMGLVKPNYYASATLVVPNSNNSIPEPTAPHHPLNELVLMEYATPTTQANATPTRLKVLYQGKPFQNEDISIQFANGWTKNVKTDKEGNTTFLALWPGQYVVLVHHHEKTPGKYKNKDYSSSWHVASYSIYLTK